MEFKNYFDPYYYYYYDYYYYYCSRRREVVLFSVVCLSEASRFFLDLTILAYNQERMNLCFIW